MTHLLREVMKDVWPEKWLKTFLAWFYYMKMEVECWKNREFWWPVLIVQKNAPKTVYALDKPGEYIKHK